MERFLEDKLKELKYPILTKEFLEIKYKELGSIPKISKELDISISTIHRAMKRFGLDINPINKYGKIITKEWFEKAYEECGSILEISKKYNISETTIWSYGNKYKILRPSKIHSINENIFEINNINEISMYLAGFIAADGCINTNKNKIKSLTIRLSSKDKDHLIKIKNALNFSGNIFEYEAKGGNGIFYKSCVLSIYNQKIMQDLMNVYQIYPRKTKKFQFPEWIKNHDLVPHFMRGYVDGDGCFFFSKKKNSNYKQLGFNIVGTELFLNSFKNIIEEKYKIYTKATIKFYNGTYTLTYGGGKMAKKIAKILYNNSPIYLDRKYNIVKEYLGE